MNKLQNDTSLVGRISIKNASRNSTFELMRIVCMLFIVFHHLITHSLHLVAGYEGTSYSLFYTTLNSFAYVAVNVFILISGYYGIKFKLTGILNFYVQCFSYGLIIYLIHIFLDNQSIGKSIINSSLFCISNANGLWFVKSYFYLYLFSPILNRSIINIDKKGFILFVVILTILNVYFGYIWSDLINSDGYTLMNFIYIYIIGRFVGMFGMDAKIKKKKYKYLFLYFIISLSFGFGCFFLINNQNAVFTKFWTYNNPLIILSSLFFFLFFVSIKFQNAMINYLASSVFAVYLITENGYISKHLYPLINAYKGFFNYNDISTFIYILLCTILVFVLCVMFDKVFKLVIVGNIEKIMYLIISFFKKTWLKIYNKWKSSIF